ncbi:Midasin (Dynein-related AAA-ATPase MDN1) (MIDAS-containing protein) [Durusdinium trenchii]|uniref:Midasin (Dynein-related AAA-ATPase MDN1) (MIDAS-containing protein) n=1 Tax=Durusdinium trenchii TaxID=1381693 RepID=A0ABP0IFQ1_9DINO
MMGRRKKTADPSFATHVSFFENIAVDQDCNIIENVTEYDEQIVKDALPAFSVTAVKVDPRVFGLGVARARIYIIAIRRSKLRWKPGFCLEDFMDSVTAQVTLQSTDYFWKKLPPQNLSRSDDTRLQNDGMKTFTFQGFQELELKDQNLKDYQGSRYKHMVDLSQLARNNRGRGETIDNAAHKRCLTGAELLASHTLPTTPAQAKWAGTPQLALDSVKETNQVCMSGNAMNATGGAELHSVPFLAMTLLKPSDGFPLLQDWLTIATDIFHQGFEGWRECVEVRCLDGSSLGKPLQYACLTPTKGITRSSIIMFGILFTFYNFKDKMTDEEVNDFSRWLKSLCSFRVKLMVDPIPELDFRRLQIHEQQAEKQRKNPLQKTMIFGRRAAELVLLEPGKEHMPAAAPSKVTFDLVDQRLETMSKDSRKMAFDADCLKLTRDVAQLGRLYDEEAKNARSNRLQRVLHLKHQNCLGGKVVSSYMDMNMRCVSGKNPDLETAAEKFIKDLGEHEKFAGYLVWLDYTKFGKLTGGELNDTCSLMASILESAQYLAGKAAPQEILTSLFVKVDIPADGVVGLLNLSPYDTWLELTAHEWPLNHADWKRGHHLMGSNVEKYTPQFSSTEVDTSKFPLQVVKLDTIPGKSGWSKYKVTLPQSFRTLHYGDILYGSEWRELISDFDKRNEEGVVVEAKEEATLQEVAEVSKSLPMTSAVSNEKTNPTIPTEEVDSLSHRLKESLEVKRGRPRKEPKPNEEDAGPTPNEPPKVPKEEKKADEQEEEGKVEKPKIGVARAIGNHVGNANQQKKTEEKKKQDKDSKKKGSQAKTKTAKKKKMSEEEDSLDSDEEINGSQDSQDGDGDDSEEAAADCVKPRRLSKEFNKASSKAEEKGRKFSGTGKKKDPKAPKGKTASEDEGENMEAEEAKLKQQKGRKKDQKVTKEETGAEHEKSQVAKTRKKGEKDQEKERLKSGKLSGAGKSGKGMTKTKRDEETAARKKRSKKDVESDKKGDDEDMEEEEEEEAADYEEETELEDDEEDSKNEKKVAKEGKKKEKQTLGKSNRRQKPSPVQKGDDEEKAAAEEKEEGKLQKKAKRSNEAGKKEAHKKGEDNDEDAEEKEKKKRSTKPPKGNKRPKPEETAEAEETQVAKKAKKAKMDDEENQPKRGKFSGTGKAMLKDKQAKAGKQRSKEDGQKKEDEKPAKRSQPKDDEDETAAEDEEETSEEAADKEGQINLKKRKTDKEEAAAGEESKAAKNRKKKTEDKEEEAEENPKSSSHGKRADKTKTGKKMQKREDKESKEEGEEKEADSEEESEEEEKEADEEEEAPAGKRKALGKKTKAWVFS